MAIALNLQRAQLAAKIESVEGVAETLTAAEAKIRVKNLALDYEAPFERDESVSSSLSPFTGTVSGPREATLTFEVDIHGSGSNGTAPAWYTLMSAMGWDVTTDALALNDDQGESLTLGWYNDGTRHLVTGARGDWTFTFPSGKRVTLGCTFKGVYNAMTDTALLAGITYESPVPPAFLSASVLFHGVSVKCSQITIAGNNNLEPNIDPDAAAGIKSYAIVGKRHITGTIDTSKVLAATKDWYATWTGNTLAALTFTHGSATGNTFAHSLPKVQITKPKPNARGNIATHDMEFEAIRDSAGSDEYTITQN